MKKLSKQEIARLEVEAENLLASLSEYKALYARLDEITSLLIGQTLTKGRITIVDNFAEKNVVFRPAGIRRFEIKRVA